MLWCNTKCFFYTANTVGAFAVLVACAWFTNIVNKRTKIISCWGVFAPYKSHMFTPPHRTADLLARLPDHLSIVSDAVVENLHCKLVFFRYTMVF
ncbi:unnamed protein product [Haemonchus placei]|uniref:Uncharacterized protein n=1 Tax=Haemonchus placei TaxID=6290 RepID=A0A3P8BK65_HAEPC|nr:unnamed protein product [Haemonchus placei]